MRAAAVPRTSRCRTELAVAPDLEADGALALRRVVQTDVADERPVLAVELELDRAVGLHADPAEVALAVDRHQSPVAALGAAVGAVGFGAPRPLVAFSHFMRLRCTALPPTCGALSSS